MNFKRLIQGILLSFGFLMIVLFFWWGMHWFSYSLETFFQFKLSQDGNNFLGSLSRTTESSNIPNKPFYLEKKENILDPEINSEVFASEYYNQSGHKKRLISANADKKVFIASLTKIMTAEIILDNFDLSAKISISKTAEERDTRKILKSGQSFKAKDLLYDMLIESDNSAAYAFSEAMGYDNFIKEMNLKADKIGMKDTYFSSPTGLADTNYSTANDFIKFAEYLLDKNSLVIEITSLPSFDLYNYNGFFHHSAKNLDKLLEDKEVGVKIIGGKTGETKYAGECLMVIARAPDRNGYMIDIVLGSSDRFGDIKKIIEWTDSSYKWE